MAELLALRDELNSDPDFVLYKTLIGYDSIHPAAWNGPHFDHVALDQWRHASQPAILADIDEDRPDEWIARVRRYLSEPIGISNHMPLINFTRGMAAAKPGVAVRMLYEMDDTLRRILVPLLEGLEAAGQTDAALQAVHRFAGQDRFLFDLGYWLADRKTPDPKLLATIADRAREIGDAASVVSTLNAAGRQYSTAPDPALISEVLMPDMDFVTQAKLTGWPRDAWWVAGGGILGAIDAAQSARVIDSLVDAPQVSHDAERVLTKVAQRFPQLVLDFFEARIRRGREDDSDRVDPVPFHLNELRVPLARHPALLLRSARRMHDFKPSYHRFFGGRLIAKIFPTLEPALANPLGGIVADGSRDDL